MFASKLALIVSFSALWIAAVGHSNENSDEMNLDGKHGSRSVTKLRDLGTKEYRSILDTLSQRLLETQDSNERVNNNKYRMLSEKKQLGKPRGKFSSLVERSPIDEDSGEDSTVEMFDSAEKKGTKNSIQPLSPSLSQQKKFKEDSDEDTTTEMFDSEKKKGTKNSVQPRSPSLSQQKKFKEDSDEDTTTEMFDSEKKKGVKNSVQPRSPSLPQKKQSETDFDDEFPERWPLKTDVGSRNEKLYRKNKADKQKLLSVLKGNFETATKDLDKYFQEERRYRAYNADRSKESEETNENVDSPTMTLYKLLKRKLMYRSDDNKILDGMKDTDASLPEKLQLRGGLAENMDQELKTRRQPKEEDEDDFEKILSSRWFKDKERAFTDESKVEIDKNKEPSLKRSLPKQGISARWRQFLKNPEKVGLQLRQEIIKMLIEATMENTKKEESSSEQDHPTEDPVTESISNETGQNDEEVVESDMPAVLDEEADQSNTAFRKMARSPKYSVLQHREELFSGPKKQGDYLAPIDFSKIISKPGLFED